MFRTRNQPISTCKGEQKFLCTLLECKPPDWAIRNTQRGGPLKGWFLSVRDSGGRWQQQKARDFVPGLRTHTSLETLT
jgi:hypothetical protein